MWCIGTKLRSFVPTELPRLHGVSHDSASPMPLYGVLGVSGVSGASGVSGVSGASLWFWFHICLKQQSSILVKNVVAVGEVLLYWNYYCNFVSKLDR